MQVEIPKGSGNFVPVNKEAWENSSQEDKVKFYREQEALYNEENLDQKIEETRKQAVERETSSIGEKIVGTARGLGQGLTLGFGDEIEAGLRTGFGLLGDYGKTVEGVREGIDDFRVSDPAFAYGSEIGGAIIPAILATLATAPAGGSGGAGVVGATGLRLANPVSKGLKALSTKVDKIPGAKVLADKTPNLYQGMKTGTGYGAVYGTGTAESDPDATALEIAKDRLTGFGSGASTGAITGAILNPTLAKGMQGISALNQNIKKTFGNKDALDRSANETILKKATQDVGTSSTGVGNAKYTPLMLGIGQRLDDTAPNNQIGGLGQTPMGTKSPIVIADAGENLRSLGYATQQIQNPSRRGVTETLVSRNQEQGSRIMDAVKQTTGVSDDNLGISFINSIDDFVKEISDPLYQQAYSVKIPAKEFAEFFKNPTIREDLIKASREAYKKFGRNNKELPPDLKRLFDERNPSYFGGFDDIMTQDLSTEFLHAIKKGLDKMVQKETITVDRFTTKLTSDGVDLNNLKNAFNNVIKKNNPAYAKANKEFADSKKLQEAFLLGSKYKTTTIDRIKDQIKNFTKAEMDAWKIGMVSKLDDIASSQGKNRDFLGEIDSSNKLDEIFDLIITDPVQKEAFKNLLKNEKAMRETYNKMRTNSDTASKTEAINEFKSDSRSVFDAESLYGLGRNIVREGVRKGQNVLSGGTNSKRAELIAQRLFTTSKSEQQKVLKALQETNEALAKEVEKRLKTAQGLIPGSVVLTSDQGE